MRYFLSLLAASFLLTPGNLWGQTRVDSLLSALKGAKNDSNKVNILDHLVFAYASIDPAKGVRYGIEGLRLAKTLSWERGVAKLSAGIGVNYAAMDDQVNALKYYNQALALSHRLHDTAATAGNLANMSLLFLDQSNYAKALEHGFMALKLYEELNDKGHIAIILENIGTIYFRKKNYPNTIDYYSRALDWYQQLGDKRALARNLGNMGMVHDAQGNYLKALENHKLALKANRTLNARYGIEINLANIGYVYAHLKDYNNALVYQQQALKLSQSLQKKTSVAINLGNIGETYFTMATDPVPPPLTQKLSHLQHSINYLTKAIELCRELKFYDPLIEFSKYLSEAYYLAGDYRQAFDNFKEYATIKDSVFSVQNHQYIANLEANRQIERKDQELRIKDHQLRITALRAAKKRDEQIIYVTTIALLLLVIGVGVKQLYIYRKYNRSLLRERQSQFEVIDEQIRSLKAHAKVLEDISYMQAHDVRGPVATILGLVENFNYKNYADPDNRVIIEGIGSISRRLDIAVKEVIKKEKAI